MVEEKDLYEKLNGLKMSIPETHWFYFHIESIDNFIFHLPNIKNERTRARAAGQIRQYLDVIEQKSQDDFEPIETYKYLHRTYIWHISHFFTDELGFIQKPHYLLHALLAIVITALLQLALSLWLAVSIVVLLFTLKMLSDTIKIKKRRFY
jgi:hypothetical protein